MRFVSVIAFSQALQIRDSKATEKLPWWADALKFCSSDNGASRTVTQAELAKCIPFFPTDQQEAVKESFKKVVPEGDIGMGKFMEAFGDLMGTLGTTSEPYGTWKWPSKPYPAPAP